MSDDKDKGTSLQFPGWILIWFYATTVIHSWEATYIFLKPGSLPGGDEAFIWRSYKIYGEVDQRYKDANNPFVFGMNVFNTAEVALNIAAVILSHRHSRHARPLGFTVSVMTFWKTLFYLYTFSELGGGAKYRVGNTFVQELFIVLLPVSVWVIVPFAVIVTLWPCMAQKGACDWSGGERQDLRKKTGEERRKET